MLHSIKGHGWPKTSYPVTFLALSMSGGSALPWQSTISASILNSAVIAEPGLIAVIPGSGEITAEPVSVCHQVSTAGSLPVPMTSRHRSQTLGLIGSLTDPRSRRRDRLCLKEIAWPHFTKVRITVRAM